MPALLINWPLPNRNSRSPAVITIHIEKQVFVWILYYTTIHFFSYLSNKLSALNWYTDTDYIFQFGIFFLSDYNVLLESDWVSCLVCPFYWLLCPKATYFKSGVNNWVGHYAVLFFCGSLYPVMLKSSSANRDLGCCNAFNAAIMYAVCIWLCGTKCSRTGDAWWTGNCKEHICVV